MPSSVKLGSRPRIFLIRSNSSGVRPCFATTSGVTGGSIIVLGIESVTLANVCVPSTGEGFQGHRTNVKNRSNTALPKAVKQGKGRFSQNGRALAQWPRRQSSKQKGG